MRVNEIILESIDQSMLHSLVNAAGSIDTLVSIGEMYTDSGVLTDGLTDEEDDFFQSLVSSYEMEHGDDDAFGEVCQILANKGDDDLFAGLAKQFGQPLAIQKVNQILQKAGYDPQAWFEEHIEDLESHQ